MKRILIIIFFLFLFGAIRLPFEQSLEKEEKAVKLRNTVLNLDLRERIGQNYYLAALSGLRSPIAMFLWISAHTAWERTEWGVMAGLFDTVTSLQPHSILYWDMSAWHMAWNASVAAFDDKKQPSEALRIRAQRQYFDLGKSFYQRGIKNNPDNYYLYERLGALERDKYQDHCAAAAAFAKAAEYPEAPAYIKRFAAYELAECPGREKDAYIKLREIFNMGELQRLPTLLTKLQDMENKLNIPKSERIPLPPAPKQ